MEWCPVWTAFAEVLLKLFLLCFFLRLFLIKHFLPLLTHEDTLLKRLIEGGRVQVQSALLLRLVRLYRDAIHVCVRILANARHLPADFDVGRGRFDATSAT